MTTKQLATLVAKQSDGVSVGLGTTNGKDVLHLIRRRNDEKGISASAQTIPATKAAWDVHPWNKESLYGAA